MARHELLPKAINLFSKTYPKVDLSIVEAPYKDMLKQLKLGEIDFLIGALRPISDTPDIMQTFLFFANLCIVADKNHPLANKNPITTHELLQYSWVLPSKGTPTRNRFEQLIENHQDLHNNPLNIIECSSMALVRGLLKDSERLALISRQQINLELQLDLLTIINYQFNDTPRKIGLTFRKNWLPSAIHVDFITHLQEIAKTF